VPDFTDRTCLITGAARGLGRAIAEIIVRNGGKVLICDLDAAAAAVTAENLGGSGKAHAFGLDVTEPAGIARLAREVGSAHRVDVLVNNAGFYSGKPIRDISPEDWDRVLDINLKSVFLMSQALMPPMMEAGYGRIVNVASLDAFVAKPTNCHYAAAKAGVVSLTKSFGHELAPHGILVNGVAPGAIATDTARSQDWFAKKVPTIPVGHAAEPEDIAELVVFLASSQNRFMVGETVVIGGGIAIV
jgi:3-oxoacyl-[acyl-carrier protein] reductase